MTDTITIPREELQAAHDALAKTREELRACQSVIHLAGGFDPAYVTDAKAAMKVADESTETLRARLAQQQNEEECRKTCTSLCAGTGDTGGDWPCVKQRG